MSAKSRRRFLGGAAVVGAAAVTATAAGAATAGERGRPTFVLVNGNSNTSFAWMPLVRELGLLGHRSVAVELPGHGLDADFSVAFQAPQDLAAYAGEPSRLATLTLADYAGAAVDVVRRVAGHGPVILVGHSLGGAVVSRVGNAVPELVDHVVYASAVCCTALRTPVDCVSAPENDGAAAGVPYPVLGDPAATGVTRMNWRAADPAFLDGYRAAAMAEATEAQFLATLDVGHQPDESATVSLEDAVGEPATWGRIPRSYVHFTEDRILTPPLQRRLVADADAHTPGNRFHTYSIPASHLGGVLLHTRAMAEILATIAE